MSVFNDRNACFTLHLRLCLMMGIEKVWQCHQLCQAGCDERECDTSLNGFFRPHAILVKVGAFYALICAGVTPQSSAKAKRLLGCMEVSELVLGLCFVRRIKLNNLLPQNLSFPITKVLNKLPGKFVDDLTVLNQKLLIFFFCLMPKRLNNLSI